MIRLESETGNAQKEEKATLDFLNDFKSINFVWPEEQKFKFQ